VEGFAYELPPLYLSIDEATALYLAARLLARYSDEHNPHSVDALKKVGQILPHMAGEQVWRSAEGLMYRVERPRLTRALEDVTRGWLQGRVVRVVYYGTFQYDEPRETHLHPYLLEPSNWGLATYVLGYSSRHSEERTFKLERFLETKLLEETFERPADFDPVTRLSSAWNVMYGDTLQRVSLRFSPDITWRVRESVWHPSQTLEELADGGCRVTFRVAYPREMRPWIRQWGQDVYVEEPDWLRHEIAADLRAAAEQYGGGMRC
jgi:predicted DNA-binding transcriptional regulator YafY